MRFTLTNPVYTVAVLAAFQDVMKQLAATKKLEHEWIFEVVKTDLKFGNNDESGVVVYPCRRGFWNKNLVPRKEKRIVLKPLPSEGKVKTKFLEVAFGAGLTHQPLLGTNDSPVKKMLGGDGKYLHDFFLIIEALKEILTKMGEVTVPSPQRVVNSQ